MLGRGVSGRDGVRQGRNVHPRHLISYHGLWKSSAVFTYVDKTIQDHPLKRSSKPSGLDIPPREETSQQVEVEGRDSKESTLINAGGISGQSHSEVQSSSGVSKLATSICARCGPRGTFARKKVRVTLAVTRPTTARPCAK